MKILLLEPFFTGSHQQWAEGLQQHSLHDVKLLTLKGRHWKWRMYGGAVELAAQFNQMEWQPDLILATDMLDLPTFLALTRQKSNGVATAVYFHENQITYPWSPADQDVPLGRNNQYGFINYTTALAADRVFFNSDFHKNSFLDSLPAFLKQFPDYNGLENVELIANKSEALPLGMDLSRFNKFRNIRLEGTPPVLLWNHRWEYDKNPDLFFESLFKLKAEGIDFKLIVLGESYKKCPPIFEKAKIEMANQILHFGFADSFAKYASLLWLADFMPVTSRQDFFGGSVVEGIYCGCVPLLPKRLAYPEHLPEAVHGLYFYEKEEDFYGRLKNQLSGFETQKIFPGKAYVEKYDWKNIIANYDRNLIK